MPVIGINKRRLGNRFCVILHINVKLIEPMCRMFSFFDLLLLNNYRFRFKITLKNYTIWFLVLNLIRSKTVQLEENCSYEKCWLTS